MRVMDWLVGHRGVVLTIAAACVLLIVVAAFALHGWDVTTQVAVNWDSGRGGHPFPWRPPHP